MANTVPEKCEIVVVGAGLAGLTCAAHLRNLGIDVVVFEASEHLGGRVRTVREHELMAPGACPHSHRKFLRLHMPNRAILPPEHSNGAPAAQSEPARLLGTDTFGFEVGAEFVHGSTTILNRLIEDRKIRLKELFTWAHGDGGVSEKPAPDGGIGMYWLGKEKRLLRYDDKDADLEAMMEVLWGLGDHSQRQTSEDPRSLLEMLRDSGVAERVLGMAEAGYANTVGGTLKKIGFAQMAQCERNWDKDGDGDYRVIGTLQEAVVPELARGLRIFTKTPVIAVNREGVQDGVEVRVSGGSKIRAAGVVLAVPIPVLQRGLIQFSPALPASKVKAISLIDCEPGTKLLAKFTRMTWPANLHGMICADSFAPELWFDKHEAPDGKVLFYCTAFFTSDQARRVAAMDTAAAFDALLDQLDEMFQTHTRGVFAGGFMCDWGAVPYIWGAYSMPSLKEAPDTRAQLAAPVDGMLFFAGEATDPHSYMTAHAAMETGVRASLEAVHAVVRGRMVSAVKLLTEKPDDPRKARL